MKKKVPRLRTDEEAKAFLEQHLSDLDFSQFKPGRFEFEKKSERINMRVLSPCGKPSSSRRAIAASLTPGSSARSWSGKLPGENEGVPRVIERIRD